MPRRSVGANHEYDPVGPNQSRSCAYKEVYTSKGAAKAACSRAKRRGDDVTYYRCPCCKRWHLSKKANQWRG